MKGLKKVKELIKGISLKNESNEDQFTKPRNVGLDASTVCQLKCPTCPTSRGTIRKNLGAGFLVFDDFKRFVDNHPWISRIELSNWGEVFLNPELERIMEYAYDQCVMLTINNGTNLNSVPERVLEALVRYKVQAISVSLDGASQETYAIYRVKGNYDRVIRNIRKINEFKAKYNSQVPYLQWKFIAFGHNEHEIGQARELAAELNMQFILRLSWDDLYFETFSPVRNDDLIRAESGLGVKDRQEYEEKYSRHYLEACCHKLWLDPRISFDGRLLGCCINHWGDYGNVFETGLEACLKGEKIGYAKQMLMGLISAKEEIPCIQCKIYKSRKINQSFVIPEELTGHF